MPAKPGSPARTVSRKSAKTTRPVWRAFQRVRRRDLILLTGVMSLACVSATVALIWVLQYQPTATSLPNQTGQAQPKPTHTVTFTQVTGLNQYAPANTAALAWAGDAQLVSANADWPKILDKAQVGEPTLWTYRFYSPANARLLFVTVTAEGQVETIQHVPPVTLPPRTITPGDWLIDSSTALAIWLDYGGAKVLGNNPGLEIVIQLRRVSSTPNPVWMVIGLNNQTEEVYSVVIDAHEGIVSTVQAGS